MTAQEIIEEIRRLEPGEQARAIAFPQEVPAARELSGTDSVKRSENPGEAATGAASASSAADGLDAARIQEGEPAAGAPGYRKIITIEPGKRGGRPCIRGLRITVGDILGWLAAGMSERQIIDDFPELTVGDIHAALAFAAERERQTVSLAASAG